MTTTKFSQIIALGSIFLAISGGSYWILSLGNPSLNAAGYQPMSPIINSNVKDATIQEAYTAVNNLTTNQTSETQQKIVSQRIETIPVRRIVQATKIVSQPKPKPVVAPTPVETVTTPSPTVVVQATPAPNNNPMMMDTTTRAS